MFSNKVSTFMTEGKIRRGESVEEEEKEERGTGKKETEAGIMLNLQINRGKFIFCRH